MNDAFPASRRVRLVVVSIGIVLTGIIAAMVVWPGYETADRPFREDWTDRADGLVRLHPNSTFLSDGGEGVRAVPLFRIETNRWGFRDRDYARSPPPNTTRILVSGDSNVFGWGMNRSDRFTERLERRLNGTQVVNMGIPGYGISDMRKVLERFGPRLSIDTAIFWIGDASAYGNDEYAAMNEEIRRTLREERPGLEGEALADEVRERRKELIQEKVRNEPLNATVFPAEVRRIRRIAEQHDIDVVYMAVHAFPDFHREAGQYINTTFLKPPRQVYGPGYALHREPYIFHPQDRHINPQGQQLLATHLLDHCTAPGCPR